MANSGSAAFRQILGTDIGSLTNRQAWLEQVIHPAYDICQYAIERSCRDLEFIVEHVGANKLGIATIRWKTVAARHFRIAYSLRALIEFVKPSNYEDLPLFVKRLRLFFEIPVDQKPHKTPESARGISRLWCELFDSDIHNIDATTREILDAEVLHLRLKWAMIRSQFLQLQSTPPAT